ncbi:MAG: hypothetical protein ACI9H8_001771, partial [Lysobacterales bacterium]
SGRQKWFVTEASLITPSEGHNYYGSDGLLQSLGLL